jgi:hypothetical protein
LRQKEIARVTHGYFNDFAARAQLFDIFLQNDLHFPDLESSL